MPKKKLAIGGAVVVALAVIGVILGIIVSRLGDDDVPGSDTYGSTSSGSGESSTATPSDGTSKASKKKTNTTKLITSDPTTATFSLCVFAIGDWGTTLYQDSCCTRSETYTNFDIVAEDVVASLMDTQASTLETDLKVILGHGDNFYYTGINSEKGRNSRFMSTFESKFKGKFLLNIPFCNVLGNHDYGGGSFICSYDDEPAKCGSVTEIIVGLENKFKWQQEYTSYNNERWVLKDHFYVYSIEDAESGVSIDIFNVDTGDADVHAALQVCCQCFGYSEGNDDSCKGVARGHKFCAGGDTEMYDACFAKFVEWSDDSRKQLAEKVATSTATWKIVNSHYSPHVHYDEEGMKEWFDVLEGSGIHVWMYGHTHGEKHDYSEPLGVHFVENGAGGGIQKESASGLTAYAAKYAKNMWTYSGNEYGFFSVKASEEWLKLQYHTADSSWSFGSSMNETTIGGVETKHCWFIPADGTEGKECTP
ncbi:unnamed protein product [Peronospora belbahrii]|uniref:Calcineurin-like phosphoesterase domain-containing protein n=1 Tax=Peronospora belbahrii TaxID=622444 RepID=A0AAU9LBX9_9STRA|nr:unnamed protein product [Peronospora belbahrii]CAH0519062.1 unnamed protein product [Peronospora belbahrii]